MSWRQFECPSCGETVPSLWASLVHCDPNEPIDDIASDEQQHLPESGT